MKRSISWLIPAVIILVFVLFKVRDLHLPYFWDELGVYAPGALRLSDHGISLLPGGLDEEYSRGHPLLCYALFGAAFRLLGDHVFTAHCLALAISCLTLTVCFAFVRERFGTVVAGASTLVLAVQPMFFAMSTLLLPEMMLTCWSLLALWGLASHRTPLYLTGACLAGLTKEAGLVWPVIAVVVALNDARTSTGSQRPRLGRAIGVALIPPLLFMVFLLIQYVQKGWFFFPYHTSLISLKPARLLNRMLVIHHMLFLEQGRLLIAALSAIGLLGLARFFPVEQRRYLQISLLFLAASVLFASVNYYLHRYLLPVLPVLVFPGLALLHQAFRKYPPAIGITVVPAVAVLAVCFAWRRQDPRRFADTNDMSYRHLVLAQRDCIRWAERQAWSNDIIVANFPVDKGLTDRRLGYLHTRQYWPYEEHTDAPCRYGIFYLEGGQLPKLSGRAYTVIRRFTNADAVFIVVHFDDGQIKTRPHRTGS